MYELESNLKNISKGVIKVAGNNDYITLQSLCMISCPNPKSAVSLEPFVLHNVDNGGAILQLKAIK